MTKTKSTKRALLMSVMSLVLCISMLVGTTFAWFTDSVTSANNIIQSGNLDIELEYWNGSDWVDVKGRSDILTNKLWEPGVTEVAYLRVANAGSLAFKYQLGVNIVSEIEGVNQAGEAFKLSDYIMFGVVENVNGETGAYATREDAIAGVTAASKISAGYTKVSEMVAEEEIYLALVVYMPTTVGNAANHNGVDVPQIDLGINVVATQLVKEEDSFGNDYDAAAPYPIITTATVTQSGTELELSNQSVKVTVPASAAEKGDTYNIVLTNENKTTDAATQETAMSFDLSLYKNNEKVSEGTAIYEIEIPVDNGVYITSVTHNGRALTKATTGADQTYKIENGKITVYTKSFSPFEVSYFEDGELVADKAGEQAYLTTFDEVRAQVSAGNDFSGWTLTLMSDIDFGGEEFAPIGLATGNGLSLDGCKPFSGMLDGNGHKLSNYKITKGVTVDGDPWMSLFALIYAKDGNTAGVKNLTLDNVTYKNVDGTVGMIVNLANSDGASALEFSNLEINGTVRAFGYYGQAGIATLMYGNEVLVRDVDVNVEFIIPEDFTVAGYKFISPCIAQIALLENGHITFENVDWADCTYLYPDSFTLEDRSTVIAGYNSIWVYNTPAGTRVLGCGGYSGQFYDRGITVTIDGVDYTHADLLKGQKDVPGYMYDYIIRPDQFTAYEGTKKVTSVEDLMSALSNAAEGDKIDATGVTYAISGAEHFNIPAGITLKGLTINANYRGGNYVMCGDNVVLENCSFGNTTRNLILAGTAESNSVTVNNCSFSGPTILNFHDNQNGVMTVNNCTFKGSATYDFAEVMGGTFYLNNCTFDFTGVKQQSMGVLNAGCFNVYSEEDYDKTVAILTGCTRTNCGTRTYGPKSTLTIK